MLKKGCYKSRESAEAAAAKIDMVYGFGSAEATRDVNYSHRVNLRGAACDVYYASPETFYADLKRYAEGY